MGSIPPGTRAVLTGDLDEPLRGALRARFPGLVEVSLDAQLATLDLERRFDDSEFSEGGYFEGTPVFAFLLGFTAEKPAPKSVSAADLSAPLKDLVDRVGLGPHLGRGLKFLSTGEFRKTLWLRAVGSGAGAILFHDPYEGLDQGSRAVLTEWVSAMAGPGVTLLAVTRRPDEIPPCFHSHLTVDGMEVHLTPRLESPSSVSPSSENFGPMPPDGELYPGTPRVPPGALAPLIDMKQVSVHYGERQVLDRLDLTVQAGEHTLIAGPNGSGKTTLVHLITGDCPQVFSNEVSLFGWRRGTGETIWEIKANFGHVSQAVHLEFLRQPSVPVAQVLLSGFQDTLGLHRESAPDERAAVKTWLGWLGLAGAAGKPWASLPEGDQRLLLVARAAIKPPRLLLLDEMGHGLSRDMRARLLSFIDSLARSGRTTVVLVTHDPAEHMPCLKQRLDLCPEGVGRSPSWRVSKI